MLERLAPLNNISCVEEQPSTDVSRQRDVGAQWVHSLVLKCWKIILVSSKPFAFPTTFSVTAPLPESCQPWF